MTTGLALTAALAMGLAAGLAFATAFLGAAFFTGFAADFTEALGLEAFLFAFFMPNPSLYLCHDVNACLFAFNIHIAKNRALTRLIKADGGRQNLGGNIS